MLINPSNAEATFVHSSRTQRFLRKPSNPCHVGIHWIALAECSQMSTHMPGFLYFVLAKLAISSIRVNPFAPVAALRNHTILVISQSNILKVFEENMFIRTLSITLPHIFCKFTLIPKLLLKKCFSTDSNGFDLILYKSNGFSQNLHHLFHVFSDL